MKKTLLLVAIPIIIILFSILGLLINKNTTLRHVKQLNSEYEYYLGKQVYGLDLATLINKAINQNEHNQIPKNEKGYYIENDENSIKIEVKILSAENTEKTYSMEVFYNNDITRFVDNFNLIYFKCSIIDYHKKTGQISKMVFEEL